MRTLVSFLAWGLLLHGPLVAQQIWTEDWEAALRQARAEKKDLLINFTGSDWCVWCQRLAAEVFDTEEFKRQVTRNWVPVKLDFPRRLAQSPQVQARNRQLASRYGVEGYPTIFLADEEGRPYARMGYQPGGPATYLRDMENHRRTKERDWELLRRAERESGAARARLWDEFYTRRSAAGFVEFFQDLIERIIAADSRNEAGLRDKYLIVRDLEALKRGLNQNSRWPQVLSQLEELESRARRGNQTLLQQDVLMVRAAIHLNALEDPAQARTTLQRVVQLDPDSTWGRMARDVLGRLR